MMEFSLQPGEQLDDLQRNGLRIIQSQSHFRFGMDAVLLSDFARVKPRERIADFGTGTGIIPLLLSQKREDCRLEAIELQPELAEMAARSVRLNGLEGRITVHGTDLRRAGELLGRESVHAVTCNPPYGKQGATLTNPSPALTTARHEEDTSIGEIARAAAEVLRNQGRLSMTFPAPRFLELCDILRQCRLEPKRARMVCTKVEKAPYLFLIEAMKNARPGLHWLAPLVVCDGQGRETPELLRIYHRA